MLYILGNIFAVQGFSSSGANFSWFISCIIVCYIMTPYFASFIEKNTIIHNFILVIFLIIASTAFIYDHKFIIVATRIPIYVIGMIFAKNDHHEIKGLIVPLLIAFMVGIIVLGTSFKFLSSNIYDYGLYWYPFILIAPFLCLMFTKVSILFERAKLLPILNAIKLIGNISFELFLIHIFIFGLYAPETDSFETRYCWLVLSLISILISILYSYMLKLIKKYSMR